jgi:hypothetical protein
MARATRNRSKGLSKAYRRTRRWLLTSVRRRLERIRYRGRSQDLDAVARAAPRLSRLPRPNFIIIGAPKCGTSWLQRALAQHPDIVMVPDEIEYFSRHLDYPLKWYLNRFARQLRARTGSADGPRAIGEKSARYCTISPDRIRLVHRIVPEARLILMTRDPVARHWSQAKRYFSKRRFNEQECGVLAIPRERLFAYFKSMRPLSEFGTIITNWTSVYSAKQLLIVSQEKALAYPLEAYNAVLDHIGVSKNYDQAAITLLRAETNLGPRLNMPGDVADYLEAMFVTERARLQELLGDRTAVYAAD